MLLAKIGEQLPDGISLPQECKGLPAVVERAFLGERDHFVGIPARDLGAGDRRRDPVMLDQTADQVGQRGPAMLGFHAQLGSAFVVAHNLAFPDLGRRRSFE